MNKLNYYNYNEFIKIFDEMITIGVKSKHLNDLKRELNKFFKDSECEEVFYTNNTDKLFFGMAVMPIIYVSHVYDITMSHEPYRIKKYYLEIDSKLLDVDLNLNPGELFAILLHEVGHMVKDSTPVDKLRKDIDKYLLKNKETIKVVDSINCRKLLLYGIKDALNKITSIFNSKNDEIIADEFVVKCGYGEELETAFGKIVDKLYLINKNVDNKFIVLAWALNIYADIKLRRLSAIQTLRTTSKMTNSKLVKKEMDSVIDSLNSITDRDIIEESTVRELGKKYETIMKDLERSGIKKIEDDLYVYTLRINNVENEDDAASVLREINIKMSIVDDYVNSTKLDEAERNRYFRLLDKFELLRDKVSKASYYKSSRSRLFINYPENYR